LTLSPPDVLLGSPPPRLRSAPAFSSSAGQECVELAASAGLILDPAQQLVLHDALGERSDGKWAAFEVAVVQSRQNGKGGIIEARELGGLFLFGERLIMHTAHQFDTALEAFRRILFLIESTPDLDSRVKRVSKAHGEEGIELRSGQRLRFKARTKGGGRGFTGDCVILDEAMILPSASMSALMPTMSARPNPQLWYLGSAVDRDEHPEGKVFSAVRRRALSGEDPSLAFSEWGSNGDPDDPAEQSRANPGVAAGRISLAHVAKERRSMSDRAFRVERMSVDDYWWDDDESGGALDLEQWKTLADADAERGIRPSFGVATAPDRSWSAVAVAWRRSDGMVQVMISDYRPTATWVASRVEELRGRWDGAVVASTAARELVPDAEEPSEAKQAQADNALSDAVVAGTLRHGNQAELNTAVRGARWKTSGNSRVLDRKGGVDISPLTAAALAVHSCLTRPAYDPLDSVR
jgi:hypothetical protein